MPIEVEVEGAVIEFPEGTSEEEILSAIQSYSPEAVSEPSIAPDPGQPEPYQVPEGFLEQMEQQELTRRQMQAYYGPGPFSPSGPEAEFTKKLYGDFPKSIGHGLELAMKPIAFAVRPVFEQLRYATGPTTYGMTGEMPGPLKPGESVIEGLTAPGPDEKGIIPSLRHFSVGLSTPEMLAVMPFAPQSRILSGMFALGGAASIPPSLEALAQAETGAETRGALTDIGLGAMVTTGAGKAALRERMPHAGRLRAQAEARLQEEGLTPEERSFLFSETWDVERPVEVVEGSDPIQKARRLEGQFMGINLETGAIEVYPSEFKSWLRGVPEVQRRQALRSRLNEESLHVRVMDTLGDKGSRRYWQLLTGVEQSLATRFYTGQWTRPKPGPGARVLTDADLGHEVVRRRLQRLEGVEPGEIAEAMLREKWTLKSIQYLEDIILKTRETLGTVASKEQLELIGRVQKNLEFAKEMAAYREPGEETPGATRRKGPMSKRGEDMAKLQALRAAQAEGEAVPMTEVGKLSAPPPITPESSSEFVRDYIGKSEDISFEGFVGKLRSKFGPVPSGQLRELFGQNVGEALMQSSGKRISEILKSMNLVKNVIGGGKPGERRLGAIPDAPKEKVTPEARQLMLDIAAERGPVEISKALNRALERKGPPVSKPAAQAQKLRNRAIAEILYNLFKESEQLRKPISRKEVPPEELGSPQSAKEPVFRTIRSSELTDVPGLGKILTSDARVFNQPVSATKRLVAMLSKETGTVDMLDVYMDARRGPVVMSPGGAPAHQTLESVMKTHRPIYSILLDEPVQNFRKRFKSVSEFQREFGREAQERMRELEFKDITGEGVEPEMEAGAEPTSGTLARPEFRTGRGLIEARTPLTDAEAGAVLDFTLGEVGKFESPADFELVIEGLRDLAERRPIAEQPVQAINSLNKMFNSVLERSPDLTPGQAMQTLATELYELHKNATSYEDFVSRTVGRFGGEVPRPGAPSEPSPTARELRAPGTATIAREPIEGVGGGLKETMARGTEVRQAAAEARVPTEAERIRQQSLQPEADPRFYKLVKDLGAAEREVQAQAEAEFPRSAGETIESWLDRMREQVGRFEEYRAAQIQAERGEIGPGAVRRRSPRERQLEEAVEQTKATLVAEWLNSRAGGFADWYSGWLAQNVRRHGGVAADEAASIAESITDRTKQIYGDMTDVLDPALVLAGGTKEFPFFQQLPTPKQVATTVWLNRLSHPAGKDTAVSRTVDAIEGRIENPPGFARDTVNAAINANLQTGALILDHPTGAFQRNMTGFGYDMFMRGEGPQFNSVIKANAKLNARPELIEPRLTGGSAERARIMAEAMVEADMRKRWKEWREENLKPLPDINRVEEINQDFIRKYPRLVTHVRTPAGLMQIIHTDLHNYLKNTALRTAHVVAFREQFHNTVEGSKKLADLDKEVRSELGPYKQEDWNSLIKTLQGRPTDTYNKSGFLAPGTLETEFLRAIDQTAIAMARRMVLSGQMVTQLPETIVSPFTYFSPQNVLQSAVRLKQLWPLMENTGQINKLMYDFSLDPANPIRSGFRFAGNLVSKAFAEHFLNEFQGKWFAANATVAVERLLSGRMGKFEKADLNETFRNVGFTKEQASRMLQGDIELLDQFKRRMPTWAVGENKLMAEGSRIGANRLINSIFRFQLYPMTKMNQFRMILGRTIEANRSGNAMERLAANKRLAKFMVGTTMQGAMLSVLAAYAFGGPEGGQQKLRQAKDEPLMFLVNSLLASMSGPLYLVWSGARYNGLMGIGEQATRLAFPFSVSADFLAMASGEGQYKDMDVFDRAGKFLMQKMPGFRVLETQIASWALGLEEAESKKLDADIKAANAWKRSTFGWTKVRENKENDTRREFRVNMRKAIKILTEEGKTDEYWNARQTAFESLDEKLSEKKQRIAGFIRSRKILTNGDGGELTPDQEDAIIKRIGEEAYDRLEAYDDMMDKAAP